MEAKNLICAGALLRLQLDTALRFYAAFSVERPHEFALAVLEGKRVRDLKDQRGNKLTDAYLVQELGREFAWVLRVYERTSGYVHLPSAHLLSSIGLTDDAAAVAGSISIKISAEDEPLPEWIYVEAVDASRPPQISSSGTSEVGSSPRPIRSGRYIGARTTAIGA